MKSKVRSPGAGALTLNLNKRSGAPVPLILLIPCRAKPKPKPQARAEEKKIAEGLVRSFEVEAPSVLCLAYYTTYMLHTCAPGVEC